ncbi:MAG: hypothetical protein KDC26_09375, partial [Armatimonadetes bacterium]|nr:hypothetical protein [Armatimonadota bacterium]
MKSCRALMFVPVLALGAIAQAADYSIKLNPDQNNLTVRVKVSQKSNFFRMPAWVPGDYELFNYGRQVKSFQFYQGGNPVPALAKDVNTWEVRAGADEVVMTIQP